MSILPLVLLVVSLSGAVGCEKKKQPIRDRPSDAAESTNEELNPEEPGSLEARCFDGDPSACDELGH